MTLTLALEILVFFYFVSFNKGRLEMRGVKKDESKLSKGIDVKICAFWIKKRFLFQLFCLRLNFKLVLPLKMKSERQRDMFTFTFRLFSSILSCAYSLLKSNRSKYLLNICLPNSYILKWYYVTNSISFPHTIFYLSITHISYNFFLKMLFS